jgi:hypothetical protein
VVLPHPSLNWFRGVMERRRSNPEAPIAQRPGSGLRMHGSVELRGHTEAPFKGGVEPTRVHAHLRGEDKGAQQRAELVLMTRTAGIDHEGLAMSPASAAP